jgi:hypothetical protein
VRSSISRFDLSKSGGGLLSRAVLCSVTTRFLGAALRRGSGLLQRAAAGSPRYELPPREILVLTLRSTELFVKYFAGA